MAEVLILFSSWVDVSLGVFDNRWVKVWAYYFGLGVPMAEDRCQKFDIPGTFWYFAFKITEKTFFFKIEGCLIKSMGKLYLKKIFKKLIY